MRVRGLQIYVVLFLLICSATSSPAEVALDGGGRSIFSVDYSIQSSLGGIGGDASSIGVRNKSGFVGQLTEPTNIQISVNPSTVNERSTVQLTGTALLDDGSITMLSDSDLAWQTASFPVASISADGQATADSIYQDAVGAVVGAYLGVIGTGTFIVRNSNPDNYGSYAGDGLPDEWQVGRFGQNNPSASPTNDFDEDTFNNAQEYVADTDPTNGTSFFEVDSIACQLPAFRVSFNSSSNRVYTLERVAILTGGSWTNPPGFVPITGSGSILTLQDTNNSPGDFYRVSVSVP